MIDFDSEPSAWEIFWKIAAIFSSVLVPVCGAVWFLKYVVGIE